MNRAWLWRVPLALVVPAGIFCSIAWPSLALPGLLASIVAVGAAVLLEFDVDRQVAWHVAALTLAFSALGAGEGMWAGLIRRRAEVDGMHLEMFVLVFLSLPLGGLALSVGESAAGVLWPMLARGSGLTAGVYIVYALQTGSLFGDFAEIALIASAMGFASLGLRALLRGFGLRKERPLLGWCAAGASLGIMLIASGIVFSR